MRMLAIAVVEQLVLNHAAQAAAAVSGQIEVAKTVGPGVSTHAVEPECRARDLVGQGGP